MLPISARIDRAGFNGWAFAHSSASGTDRTGKIDFNSRASVESNELRSCQDTARDGCATQAMRGGTEKALGLASDRAPKPRRSQLLRKKSANIRVLRGKKSLSCRHLYRRLGFSVGTSVPPVRKSLGGCFPAT